MTTPRKRTTNRKKISFAWLDRWRHIAAYVYLLICLTDFMIMPMYYEYSANKMTPERIVEVVKNLDSASQVEAIRILYEGKSWSPITMTDGAFFHLAFAPILTAAAWTRGMERRDKFNINPLNNQDQQTT